MLAKIEPGAITREELQRLEALRREAMPARTRRTYRQQFGAFAEWCRAKNVSALPAAPETLAAYVSHLGAEGLRVGSVRVACCAVHAAHMVRRVDSPRYDICVREALRGLARRQAGMPGLERDALTPAHLERMVRVLPATLIGARDRAVILFGWASCMRRSELVQLEVGDVRWQKEGATIRIRKSKTDQEGHGETIAIFLSQRPELCPVRALGRWMALGKITKGPLFRRVYQTGLVGPRAISDGYVWTIVKRTCELAGIPAERMGAHSLRAGFITTAAKSGRPMHVIAATSRHRDLNVLRRYVRDVDALANGAGKGLLDR